MPERGRRAPEARDNVFQAAHVALRESIAPALRANGAKKEKKFDDGPMAPFSRGKMGFPMSCYLSTNVKSSK